MYVQFTSYVQGVSPNLDVNDEFVRSRSSYSLKNGKTVRELPMMESLYIEIIASSETMHRCSTVHVPGDTNVSISPVLDNSSKT